MTSITLVSPARAPGGDQVGSFGEAAVQEGHGDRRFDVDFLPRHHAGEHGGHQDVENGADDQRGDDADGQVALRILGFLRGGGDGVESDIGEEDVGRARADARETHGRERTSSRVPSWRCSRSACPSR